MYSKIGAILLVIGGMMMSGAAAQSDQCSAQPCYERCVRDSYQCLNDCWNIASQIRNRRQANRFHANCQRGCDDAISNCIFRQCDVQCPVVADSDDPDQCHEGCERNALLDTIRCITTRPNSADRDSCIGAANSKHRGCQADCPPREPVGGCKGGCIADSIVGIGRCVVAPQNPVSRELCNRAVESERIECEEKCDKATPSQAPGPSATTAATTTTTPTVTPCQGAPPCGSLITPCLCDCFNELHCGNNACNEESATCGDSDACGWRYGECISAVDAKFNTCKGKCPAS
ncbi:uncharacterized protein BO72DRAFT_496142 [Aspergillus fijiensis CBS 313.89]|uniref:Extracellular membrane protein CFEM domain-containing protein n=1 Tax=Aspergillus fijiensis CBS 313.89 TaxID=1448319 RepID=A0A8G1VYP6_9EURO|nr:uncharacterized protein BO72DRAFT_496142 [Aspergillus fijiensis CBS 313.89]RAK77477.1 hypothetical protein BO72DRAFT_496142 [Aspergillus fijiensis CBS 313.89]